MKVMNTDNQNIVAKDMMDKNIKEWRSDGVATGFIVASDNFPAASFPNRLRGQWGPPAGKASRKCL